MKQKKQIGISLYNVACQSIKLMEMCCEFEEKEKRKMKKKMSILTVPVSLQLNRKIYTCI